MSSLPSSPSLLSTSIFTLSKRPAFLRFSPQSPYIPSSLIVSTYQLDSSSRSGSLHVIEDYSNPSISTREIPTEGGFRFTFLPDQSQCEYGTSERYRLILSITVIAALTTGRLALISLEDYSITQVSIDSIEGN